MTIAELNRACQRLYDRIMADKSARDEAAAAAKAKMTAPRGH